MADCKHIWLKESCVDDKGRNCYRYKCSICGEYWKTYLDGFENIETWRE